MPFNIFQDPESIGWRLRIVVLTQKPQATRPVLIHQRVHTLHHRLFVLIHYGRSLARFRTPNKADSQGRSNDLLLRGRRRHILRPSPG